MNNEVLLSILERTNPFALLDRKDLCDVVQRLAVRNFDDGAYVFRQGDAGGDCLFIIADGRVEIVVEDEDRVEKRLGGANNSSFLAKPLCCPASPIRDQPGPKGA